VIAMRHLSPEERGRIEAAVTAAEKRTSAEFAVIVARQSDEYAFFPLLWAALLALLTGGAVAILSPMMSVSLSFAVQAGVFLTVGLVLHFRQLRPYLAPPAVRREYASRMAKLQFAERVSEKTAKDEGVLLFVSLAEKHVEILADSGIAALIPPSAFQYVIDQFILRVRQGRLAEGVLAAIEGCVQELQPHFPARPDEPNEIANRVTEI